MKIEVIGRNFISKIEFCCEEMSERFLDDDVTFGEASLFDSITSDEKNQYFNFCPFCGEKVKTIKKES
jgi:hypothetical protein